MRIHASVIAPAAGCPDCGNRSRRVHSRYQRSVADAAIGSAETMICLRVRRFFCDDAACARKTFAEQVSGLSVPHARRTPLLRAMLEWIAMAVGGRPDQRLTRRLTIAASRMTLLRLIRALPLAEPGEVTVLGVDDFAFRRGHTYGTILVDMLEVVPGTRHMASARSVGWPGRAGVRAAPCGRPPCRRSRRGRSGRWTHSPTASVRPRRPGPRSRAARSTPRPTRAATGSAGQAPASVLR